MFMKSNWENEKHKRTFEREAEQKFNEDEYDAKFLYFCQRYNERIRLQELLKGPLASTDLNSIKKSDGTTRLSSLAYFNYTQSLLTHRDKWIDDSSKI